MMFLGNETCCVHTSSNLFDLLLLETFLVYTKYAAAKDSKKMFSRMVKNPVHDEETSFKMRNNTHCWFSTVVDM
jgi:hypothetical protein